MWLSPFALFVAHFHEEEPGGRRGRAGARSILRGDKLGEGIRRPLAAANLDECADDVSHHVAQKGVRLDVVVKQLALAANRVAVNPADGMRGVTAGGLKSGKVLLAFQRWTWRAGVKKFSAVGA